MKKTASFSIAFALSLSAAILCAAPSPAADDWTTLEDCSVVSIGGNDGDSFYVQCPTLKHDTSRRKVFRLYYVDTPESDDSVPERIAVQKEYWDLPDDKTVVKCGKMAKEFTEKFLQKRFTVHTQWEDAMGRTEMGRNFAMVVGGDGEDLGMALVRAGLARVYGRGPELSGLSNPYRSATANAWWAALRKVEAQARHDRAGCWAYSGSKGAKLAAAEERADTSAPVGPGADAGTVPGPATPPAVGRGTIGPHRPAPLPAAPAVGRGTVGPARPAPLPAPGIPPAAAPSPASPAPSATPAAHVPVAPHVPVAAHVPPAAPETVYPKDMILSRPLDLYSLKNPGQAQPVIQLPAGTPIRVMGEESLGRLRIRFTHDTGGLAEAAALQSDLAP